MPRTLTEPVDLAGLVLTDACGDADVDLGALPGRRLLSVIRHRY